MASLSSVASSEYTLPDDTPIHRLQSKDAFAALTPLEQRYAYHLSQASWHGGLIVLHQTSPESPLIFRLLIRVLGAQTSDELRAAAKAAGASDTDVDRLFMYAAGFFTNMGNYKSFGDTKFVPAIAPEAFERILRASRAWDSLADTGVFPGKATTVRDLWEAVRGPMYSLQPRECQMGLGAAKGITTYYSYDCDEDDARRVQAFMDAKGISPYNTRLFKRGPDAYELRLAASLHGHAGDDSGDVPAWLGDHSYEGATITVTRGDYGGLLNRVIDELSLARHAAANENQSTMLTHYINSFRTGSIEDHKSGSRAWIRDRNPAVESYIGFIESYRDPQGVRGEFEGFVAVVNKELSRRFQSLVDMAENIIARLPWPAAFEKDTFLRPDFTSLEIVAYGGSGVPAGINIPNYDDIRQNDGFKNVSLGNVLRARSSTKPVPFLADADQPVYAARQGESFQVQVALHELLGHGSGKLLAENADGTLNFARNLIDPTTGAPVASWYRPNETYDAKFGAFSSAYEECRAEAVGLYLCLEQDVLNLFGCADATVADEVVYVNWLSMARAGLLALEFFTPETGAWRQAHMQARFVLLRVMLEAGEGLVNIMRTEDKDGPNCHVLLDRTKIASIGKPAIGRFLESLQVIKATGDNARATAFFGGYSKVTDELMALRPIVLARKAPRPMYHMPVLRRAEDGTITFTETPDTPQGVVDAYVARYRDVEHLVEVSDRDLEAFKL